MYLICVYATVSSTEVEITIVCGCFFVSGTPLWTSQAEERRRLRFNDDSRAVTEGQAKSADTWVDMMMKWWWLWKPAEEAASFAYVTRRWTFPSYGHVFCLFWTGRQMCRHCRLVRFLPLWQQKHPHTLQPAPPPSHPRTFSVHGSQAGIISRNLGFVVFQFSTSDSTSQISFIAAVVVVSELNPF